MLSSHNDVEAKVCRNKKIVLIIAAVSILLAGTFFFVPAKTVLSISNRKNPKQRFYSVEGAEYGFCISYTHSVNKGRVHDYYRPSPDNKLILDRTIFVSYGAGIPEPEETKGAVFTVLPNGYEISGLNRTVPQLVMAVGLIAEHSIAFLDDEDSLNLTEHFLKDYFAPQTSIILKIKRVSLFEYIKTKKI